MSRSDMIVTYFRLSEKERLDRCMDPNTLRILKGKTFAVGKAHFVVLNSNGTVSAYGDNSDGQCEVGEWSGVSKVVAGDYHTAALKKDGTVVAVGSNSRGQCGVGSWRGVIELFAEGEMTVGITGRGNILVTGSKVKDSRYIPKKEPSPAKRYADVADLFPTPESHFYYSLEYNSIRIWDYIGQDKTVVIPSHIQGKTVRIIDQKAFEGSQVEEIVIPPTITIIGQKAFYSCPNLRHIYLSNETKQRLFNDLYRAVENPNDVLTT